jgi:cyclin H
MKLSEDDLYRTSTQFTHWSFTPQQLATQRVKTNLQATERVKANVARQRAQRSQPAESDSVSSGVDNGSGANTPLLDRGSDVGEVDCLTADEELKLVDYFCDLSVQFGGHCKFPIEVTVRLHTFKLKYYSLRSVLTTYWTGNMRTVSAPLLPLQLAHDLPRPEHIPHRHVPRVQD